jgi:hypothetical protein
MIEKLFKILSSSKAKTKRRRYPQKDDGFFKEFLLLARLEMDKNGLLDWRLELDFAKVTILHEIAHALVGPKHGHDKFWKLKARELGCSAKRCHSLEFSKYKWVRFCPNLCWEQKIHRKNTNLICKNCGAAVNHKLFLE